MFRHFLDSSVPENVKNIFRREKFNHGQDLQLITDWLKNADIPENFNFNLSRFPLTDSQLNCIVDALTFRKLPAGFQLTLCSPNLFSRDLDFAKIKPILTPLFKIFENPLIENFTLDLSYSGLNEEVLSQLLDVFKTKAYAKNVTIKLCWNGFSDKSIQTIIESLENSPFALGVILDLSGNKLTAEQLKKIEEKALTNKHFISLSHADFSIELKGILAYCNKRNELLRLYPKHENLIKEICKEYQMGDFDQQTGSLPSLKRLAINKSSQYSHGFLKFYKLKSYDQTFYEQFEMIRNELNRALPLKPASKLTLSNRLAI